MSNKKVLVALSGGVDSAVTAYLLKKQGYEVYAVWLRLCDESGTTDHNAKAVANFLGMPLTVVDGTKLFESQVLEYFVNEYLCGRTPNPCTKCNRLCKFHLILKLADKLGIQTVATGHYAIVDADGTTPTLKCGLDTEHDQSYYLFNLTREQLSRIVFPIGHLRKAEIRSIAHSIDLPVANVPDSQDICFLPADTDYRDYLLKHCPKNTIKPGDIRTEQGALIGTHKGLPFYTVGQRRGLHLDSDGPWFVTRLDTATNTLVVGKEDDLRANGLTAKTLNWLSKDLPTEPFETIVMIRYRQKPFKARVTISDSNLVRVSFFSPQLSVMPGQAVVFYNDNVVLGGAFIESVTK